MKPNNKDEYREKQRRRAASRKNRNSKKKIKDHASTIRTGGGASGPILVTRSRYVPVVPVMVVKPTGKTLGDDGAGQ